MGATCTHSCRPVEDAKRDDSRKRSPLMQTAVPSRPRPTVLLQPSSDCPVAADGNEVDTVEGAALPDLGHECTGSVNPRFGMVVEGVKQRPGHIDQAGRLRQRLGHHGAGHDEHPGVDLTVEAKRLPPTQEGRKIERGSDKQEVGLLLPLWKRAQPVVAPTVNGSQPAKVSEAPNVRASSSMVRTSRSLERDPEAGRSPKTHRKRSTP